MIKIYIPHCLSVGDSCSFHSVKTDENLMKALINGPVPSALTGLRLQQTLNLSALSPALIKFGQTPLFMKHVAWRFAAKPDLPIAKRRWCFLIRTWKTHCEVR